MKFEGAIPALVTPFDSTGNLSEEMLRRLVEVHIKAGATGLYVCGVSGEGPLLRTEERKKVVEIVVDQTRQRIPVIVHVGSIATDEAVELACHAQKAGTDAVSSVPPFFYSVSTDGVYRHYARIAASCKLPLIVYNISALTGVTVTPDMMAKLIQIPTVTGIKFSSYNLFHMQQMVELDNRRVNVLAGMEDVFLAALAMGADGSIGLTLNFALRLFADIFGSFRSGRWDQARELQNYANRVIRVLEQFPVIPALKEIMRFKSYDCGLCRRPLEPLSEKQSQELHDGLAKLGFFEKELGL